MGVEDSAAWTAAQGERVTALSEGRGFHRIDVVVYTCDRWPTGLRAVVVDGAGWASYDVYATDIANLNALQRRGMLYNASAILEWPIGYVQAS